ncbi:MAG: hypothetical protein ABFC18_03495 [Rikenellaceae bacterium]
MAVTDYTTECGALPQTFIQMLANLIVGFDDIAGINHYRLNVTTNSVACTELTLFPDCDVSHIPPERQLVENIFGLDDCGRLTMKIISNTDNDWTDYGECNEMPQSWMQMLSRSIVTYGTTNYLNAVIDSAACADMTQLLDCDVNNIEAERLLVNNLFAVDDCGNMLLKIVSDSDTMTDYNTECTQLPQTFMQLLARCIVLYDGHYYLNVAVVTNYCDDLSDFWTCSINHIDPERALAENVFATDSCGNLALKLFVNNGAEGRQ